MDWNQTCSKPPTRTLNHPHFGLVYGTGFPTLKKWSAKILEVNTSKRHSGEIRIQNALKPGHQNVETKPSMRILRKEIKDPTQKIVIIELWNVERMLSAKLLPHLCWCDKFKSPELLKVTAPSRLWANPKWLEESTLGQHTFFNIDWGGRHRRHPIFRSIAADQATKALAFPSFSFWKVLVPTSTNHSSLFRKDTRRCMTSCVSSSIHFHHSSFLTKVVLTILKNDGVRQWEGWHPIYEMDKIKHVPNHQPDYNYIYIPSGYLYIYTIWFFIYIIIYIPTSSMTISIYRAFAWHATDLLDICMVKSPGWPALWAVFDHHPQTGRTLATMIIYL